jgi:hypothetical protein
MQGERTVNYELTIESEHDMTEDERVEAVALLDGTHDAAFLAPRRIEVAGVAHRADVDLFVNRLTERGYSVIVG